jgi:hypothetical protein
MNKKYPTFFLTWFNKFTRVPYLGIYRLSLYKIFHKFAHKVFLPFSCETVRMIHIDLHHQYFIKKQCHYFHLVNLPIHGRSYCENAFHDNKFGYGGKVLVEIYSDYLKYIFATNHTLSLPILPDTSSWCGTTICTLHSCAPLEGWSILTYHWSQVSHNLLALQPSTYSHLWISMFCTNSNDHP